MFTRFRATPSRLQVSIVETRRVHGRVCHEHVAGLGSARLPLSRESRIEFWKQIPPRLERLANRLDADTQAKVVAAVDARIPIVTMEEIRAQQLEAAQADAKFWEGLQANHQDLAAGHEQVAVTASRTAAQNKQAAENAGQYLHQAQERISQLEHGEAVAGSLTKVDVEQLLRKIGVTKADRRHWRNVHRIHEIGATEEYLDAIRPDKRRERRVARKILAKRLRSEGRIA